MIDLMGVGTWEQKKEKTWFPLFWHNGISGSAFLKNEEIKGGTSLRQGARIN